jgi:hypothetical protein
MLKIVMALSLLTAAACATQEHRGYDGLSQPEPQQLRDIKDCQGKLSSLPEFTACMEEKGYRRIDAKFSPLDQLI